MSSTQHLGDGSSEPGTTAPPSGSADQWWRHAVVYQIYPRSFADSNGDGTGDIDGIRNHLDYLASLGIDALWITPWYASPLADGGYDVADYRAIDPMFGDLAAAEALIAEAKARGLRVIVDIVPNHVSVEHAWFQEALSAEPNSEARRRFWFHPGKGSDGSEIPTQWVSDFQGNTWTRTTNPDGTPGQWYLHLFSPAQPDLNWTHPDVQREHEEILRFWFDRGAAGVRIDSAALPAKDPSFPEVPENPAPGEHPYLDRNEIHDIYRAWRAVADSYEEPRILVGEVWLENHERFAQYLSPDEMHTAFNFDFMARAWDSRQLRESIQITLDAHAPVGAPATWVLSNHDVTRPVTRYGRQDSSFSFAAKRFGTPTDLATGDRRARAAALLAAALPGGLYIYQGEELGLPEVETLTTEQIQDPMHERSGGVDPGRDGCRIPLPWTSEGTNFGFSPRNAASPWLPQPENWGDYSVQAQEVDPTSMLHLYRSILALRRNESAFQSANLRWVDAIGAVNADRQQVLAFARESDNSTTPNGDATIYCVVNFQDKPVAIPFGAKVLLRSDPNPVDPSRLGSDEAAWWRL